MQQAIWKQRIIELMIVDGNESCADCGVSGDTPANYISVNIGAFVCIDCVGIHRSLGVHISKTKSILLDNLDEEIYKQLEGLGNLKVKEIYEHSVPECWVKPTPKSCNDIREQWIRAKYGRKEFVEDAEPKKYVSGTKCGWLCKRKKDGKSWFRRYFELSSETGTLCYYKKQNDPEPKQSMHVKDLNVAMMSKGMSQKEHSMLLTFVKSDGSMGLRHIFLHADTGFDIVDWFLSIRASRYIYLQATIQNEGFDRSVVSNLLSREYIKMGYLHKTGPKDGDGWKKRFIFIDVNRFLYCQHALDPIPIGEVTIGEGVNDDAFTQNVFEGVDGNHPDGPTIYCFKVYGETDGKKRMFNFCADSKIEMDEWMKSFRDAMNEIQLDGIQKLTRQLSMMSNIPSRSSRMSIRSTTSSSST